MKISFSKLSTPARGTVVLTVAQTPQSKRHTVIELPALKGIAAALDHAVDEALRRAMRIANFSAKYGEALQVLAPGAYDRVVLVGLGDPAKLDIPGATHLGAVVYDAISGDREAIVILESVDDENGSEAPLSAACAAAHLAGGARLKSYRFSKYRTRGAHATEPRLSVITVQSAAPAESKKLYQSVAVLVDGVFLTRDLVNEPPNVLYPDAFARRAKALAAKGVRVEVLNEPGLRRLGMGAFLGVGQGSEHPPRLVVLRWNGAKDKGAAPLALVGKGVCFDSGGISLKPSAGMWEMKWDMAGAAIVAGTMQALASRRARLNVVGLCGMVENMPDARAQRPGDVVMSMSGQTIEVQNTDSEGRLVLADVLWYAQQRFKPIAIVDVATLTGAITQTFSEHYAGLFTNSDRLGEQLTAAGRKTGERVWRLPMGDEYDRELTSLIGDMRNTAGAKSSSINAAQFLQRFVQDVPWAHLDIAGVVWNEKGTPFAAPGATGFGVRLLDTFISTNYEL